MVKLEDMSIDQATLIANHLIREWQDIERSRTKMEDSKQHLRRRANRLLTVPPYALEFVVEVPYSYTHYINKALEILKKAPSKEEKELYVRLERAYHFIKQIAEGKLAYEK